MFRLLCPFPRVRTAVNIDFGLDPVFSWYVVLLCISGIAMLAIAAIKSSGQSTAARAFNALVGVGFLGYGIYLGFIFSGETYIIFFKAFILPVLLLVNFFRSLAGRKNARQQEQYQQNHEQQPQPQFQQAQQFQQPQQFEQPGQFQQQPPQQPNQN